VYLQPFPGTTDEFSEPWVRAAVRLGVPKVLFSTRPPLTGNPYRSNYAVTANGQRFLVNARIEDAPSAINVILNWTALLKK
jgi:hypothetical protein